jgi:uncharacterized protein (DUF111 family)
MESRVTQRETIQVPIWNTHVDCKIGYLGTQIVSIKAEYEQCKQLVIDHKIHHSIQHISEMVVQKAKEMLQVKVDWNNV